MSSAAAKGDFVMEEKKYFLIEEDAVPEVFHKVMEAKRYLATGKAKNSSYAAKKAQLSRSAFYKYKDKIMEYRLADNNVITLFFSLEDLPGVLSSVINKLYECGANILTVNQNIPSDGVASVTISLRTSEITMAEPQLLEHLRQCAGVVRINKLS